MTCWVKLPTPALPGSGSRRPETAVCFDLSRGCPSAPLFLCPNLLYTPTADCQAFQILSTRFPQVLHAFFNVLSSVPGILQLYSQNTQTGVIDMKKKRILCEAVAPQGRMRGKLPIANRKRAAMASSALISHLTVTASPSGEAKKRTPNRVPAFLSVKIYLLILIRSAPGSTTPEATTSTSLKSSVFVMTVITTAG